jgi:hypothetical protein
MDGRQSPGSPGWKGSLVKWHYDAHTVLVLLPIKAFVEHFSNIDSSIARCLFSDSMVLLSGSPGGYVGMLPVATQPDT